MKKIVSILLAMTLVLSGMSAMAMVTKAGTAGTPTMDENFGSLTPGQFSPAADSNWKIVKDMETTTATDDNGYITITEDGALKVAKSAAKLGAMYTADTKLLMRDDLAAVGATNGYECVVEFDAQLDRRHSIALGNSGNDSNKYLEIYMNTEDEIILNGAPTTVVLIPKQTGMHHYKIIMRGKNFTNNDEKARMEYYATIYIDGVCRALDVLTRENFSSSSSRGIDELFVGSLSSSGAYSGTTIDNIKMYALNNEDRSDVCVKYLDSSDVEFSKDATSPATTMATAGSKLTAEIRYQGTVSENETVRVFLAQFDKDGVLKNVSFTDGTVTAGSNDKIAVTLESTADAPLCIDAKEDDYLTAFIWTADEMIPLCAEATVGKTE